MHKPSPFAVPFPSMPEIKGVMLSGVEAGIRYKNRTDLMLASFTSGTQVAGVFTKNKMPGIPVDWCRAILKKGKARALVVNSGNSNVFTGKKGREVVKKTAAAAARLLKCRPEEVFISSTGVIGEILPVEKLVSALPEAKKKLGAKHWKAAAGAIMTTDTFMKGVTRSATIGGVKVNINGFAKGSGMIAPDMATMLAYLFTDAAIPARVLQSMLSEDVDVSFNTITVDSDTSTSDTVLAFATGAKKHPKISSPKDAALKDFRKKFTEVMKELALLVVKDGEGITKLVKVTVKGAASDAAARRVGLSIANSPLVKTAIAGEDANWGRIIAAIGKAGEKANRDKTSVWIGGHLIAKEGRRNPSYKEAPVAKHMKGGIIEIAVAIGVGRGEATVWTSDLTHAYIDINVGYRS